VAANFSRADGRAAFRLPQRRFQGGASGGHSVLADTLSCVVFVGWSRLKIQETYWPGTRLTRLPKHCTTVPTSVSFHWATLKQQTRLSVPPSDKGLVWNTNGAI
jgi:hypothetical protein